MQAVLSFQFDAFRKLPSHTDLARMDNLDELAKELFGLH